MSGHTAEKAFDPQILRDHADRIEADDVPAVRAAALLREAAQAMHGFYDTREMRRIELERLYAVEKSHADLVKALEEIVSPVATLQKRAEANGDRLSEQAHSICNSAVYLQGIAAAALATLTARKAE